MSHIHIHRSVISPSRMAITNEWAALVSRRKLQLACAGGRRDVSILHRLVLVSNFARAHEDPAPPSQPEFVFPDPQPPLDEAGWLDAILQELDDEAEAMVSCLPDPLPDPPDAPDDDVIVCDSYFSICDCPPQPQPADDPTLSDLPFYSPSLDSLDPDSDEEGPTTPSTSFVDPDTPNHQDCHDPYDEPHSLFDESPRSPIIRTCVPYNPLFISTYY